MVAAESSFLGLAKQAQKGTLITADASFKYLLFGEGGFAPQNLFLPLDTEVGGGAMLRNIIKSGVMSAGAVRIIPRPVTLGSFLLGALGYEKPVGPAYNEDVLPKTTLLATPQTDYETGIENPPVVSKLFVKGWPAGATLTGNVVLTGTDASDQVLEETVALSNETAVESVGSFKTLTSVDLPARVTAGDQISIGYNYHATAYEHKFRLGADQFDAPYFSFRSAPGNLWGETYRDCRIAGLGLEWKAADFLRGTLAVTGGEATPNVTMATWNALSYVDGGPQFILPISHIEVPDGTSLKVLDGAIAFGLNIPMDEQWIVGSYFPDDFDINARTITLTLSVKVTDKDLYTKANYDGSNAAAAAWATTMLREADIDLQFLSDQDAVTGVPYRLRVKANGQSGSGGNVAWSVQPIQIRAGRQLRMVLTGTFLASPDAAYPPVEVSLINGQSAAY